MNTFALKHLWKGGDVEPFGTQVDGRGEAGHLVPEPAGVLRWTELPVWPVQIWVPDVNAEGFAAEAHRQSRAVA